MELTAESILGAVDMARERVDVPEWGGYLWVSTMDGAGRDDFEQEVQRYRGEDDAPIPNARARLLVRTLTDSDGRRIFSREQVEALGAKCAVALQKLFDVAMRLNGLDRKTAENLEKN